MEKPQKGCLLLSEPFLNDENFRRSVVLLTEHNKDGSMGFILNRSMPYSSDELVPGLFNKNLPISYGGPVESNTLHILIKSSTLVDNALHISNNIWWGGDIDIINGLLSTEELSKDCIRLFLGYSGWSPQQLDDEINDKVWWSSGIKNSAILFSQDLDNMWAEVVKSLGRDFAHLANPPEDPFLN